MLFFTGQAPRFPVSCEVGSGESQEIADQLSPSHKGVTSDPKRDLMLATLVSQNGNIQLTPQRQTTSYISVHTFLH